MRMSGVWLARYLAFERLETLLNPVQMLQSLRAHTCDAGTWARSFTVDPDCTDDMHVWLQAKAC